METTVQMLVTKFIELIAEEVAKRIDVSKKVEEALAARVEEEVKVRLEKILEEKLDEMIEGKVGDEVERLAEKAVEEAVDNVDIGQAVEEAIDDKMGNIEEQCEDLAKDAVSTALHEASRAMKR